MQNDPTTQKLTEEIYKTFPSKGLGDGVSWAQTFVIDAYGTAEEEEKARQKDAHIPWPQLVDDPHWWEFQGQGGFSFLDAKGFRHYLPAAMIRCLRSGSDNGILFHLHFDTDEYLEKWSELDTNMQRLVARFISHMVDITLSSDAQEAEEWQRALDKYWGKFLPDKK